MISTNLFFTITRCICNPDCCPFQVFDWQEERPRAEGQSDEGWNQVKERGRIHSDQWVTAMATRIQEVDVEPFDYDLDISREVDTHPLDLRLSDEKYKWQGG